jgi:hypothetical protein
MKQDFPSADQAAMPPQTSAEALGEATENCRRILGNLLDISNEMAEILAYQIRSQTDDPEAARKTVAAFTPLAQSIRRTIMLHEKLGKPAKPRPNRIAARRRIIRDVEDAIEREARSPAEQETLHAEFLERLDRPDLEDDIADRSIVDIVTDITRDLGLPDLDGTNNWQRRIPHDIAILNARAAQLPGAAPSSELLALLASAPPPPPRTSRLTAAAVAKMSDEEIEQRLERLGHYRERNPHPTPS